MVLVLLALPGAGPALAGTPDPQLDTTFGAGARFFDIRGTGDISGDILTLPDGRMILGGTSRRPSSSTQQDVVVTRRFASGKPDPSFGGGDGVVLINLSPANLRDLALAPDGKIVGLAATATDSFLFRLNADGSLDTDTDSVPSSHFDHDGIVHLNFGNADESWYRVAAQNDGSVLAVGGVRSPTASDPDTTAVARFTSLGVPDSSFDGDGLRTIKLGSSTSLGQDIGVDPNSGAIVVTVFAIGANGLPGVGVARLLPADGSLDHSFSGDGKLVTPIDQNGGVPVALVVQPNGKIAVAARHDIQSNAVERTMFLRYTAAGALDPSFAAGGMLDSTATDELDPRTLLLGAGASLVSTATADGLGVVRLTSGGALDSTFGTGGIVRQGFPEDGSSITAALTMGGSLLLLGDAGPQQPPQEDLFVLKLTSSGTPDVAFAPGLKAQVFDFGLGAAANAVAATGNRRILLAGVRQTNFGREFVVRRVLSNGYSDPAFGGNGETSADFGTASEEASDDQFGTDGLVRLTFGTNLAAVASAVAVQQNGRVVVAGAVNGDFAVARLTTDGLPDPSFSGDGRVRTDIVSGSFDGAADVVIQGDGKILVVGSRTSGGSTRFAIVRYTAAGVLDPTFSGDGKLVLALGPNSSEGDSIMVRPDGRIVVVGKTFGGPQAQIAIARLLPNGTPDTSFSGDGRATIPIGSGDAIAMDDALTTGNKVVVGGFKGDGEFLVVRLTAAGALDTTFSGDGFETTSVGVGDARSVAIQPSDGRILLAGEAPDTLGTEQMALVRYDP